MIQVSQEAREQLKKLMDEKSESGVRVFIQGFG